MKFSLVLNITLLFVSLFAAPACAVDFICGPNNCADTVKTVHILRKFDEEKIKERLKETASDSLSIFDYAKIVGAGFMLALVGKMITDVCDYYYYHSDGYPSMDQYVAVHGVDAPRMVLLQFQLAAEMIALFRDRLLQSYLEGQSVTAAPAA